MKAFICIVLSLAIGYSSFSQNTYCVTYKDFGRNDEISYAKVGNITFQMDKVDYLLAFNDTMAISFFGGSIKHYKNAENFLGKKITSHSSYFLNKSKSLYVGISLSKRILFIARYSKRYSWNFVDTSKKIINYICKLAYHVTSKNDTLIAWYSPDVQFGYGFQEFNGLPGLVLESISQVSNRHLIATKIEKIDQKLYFPFDKKIYYHQDWIKTR
ncbi:MAG: GLPGLI family protein [Chitinophagaceae bacterium]|nr:GLPGLI family protein [Chitinophagaceae bacterium]